MAYKAEYIWIDGTEPVPILRSKTKIIDNDTKPGVWGFDGSSTGQAPGNKSDCVLEPKYICKDPFRKESIAGGGTNYLVLCEVSLPGGDVHPSNTRRGCVDSSIRHYGSKGLFGFEQEYTLVTKHGDPLGFKEARTSDTEKEFQGQTIRTRNILPQGPYYCGVGSGLAVGRSIVEEHLDACLYAGFDISGINAEVMPGQWEFQIGPVDAVTASDQLWVARWLLHRVAEKHGAVVSFSPKPASGDWNGAGCHTNFSTTQMRDSYSACIEACEALKSNHELHVTNYGHDIESRLTGKHETCSYKEFKYGVSDRGASVRIPWQVNYNKKGYIEDRRPNANCDPYVVSALMLETICGK